MGEVRRFRPKSTEPIIDPSPEVTDQIIDEVVLLLVEAGLIQFPGDGTEMIAVTTGGWTAFQVILAILSEYSAANLNHYRESAWIAVQEEVAELAMRNARAKGTS